MLHCCACSLTPLVLLPACLTCRCLPHKRTPWPPVATHPTLSTVCTPLLAHSAETLAWKLELLREGGLAVEGLLPRIQQRCFLLVRRRCFLPLQPLPAAAFCCRCAFSLLLSAAAFRSAVVVGDATACSLLSRSRECVGVVWCLCILPCLACHPRS